MRLFAFTSNFSALFNLHCYGHCAIKLSSGEQLQTLKENHNRIEMNIKYEFQKIQIIIDFKNVYFYKIIVFHLMALVLHLTLLNITIALIIQFEIQDFVKGFQFIILMPISMLELANAQHFGFATILFLVDA